MLVDNSSKGGNNVFYLPMTSDQINPRNSLANNINMKANSSENKTYGSQSSNTKNTNGRNNEIRNSNQNNDRNNSYPYNQNSKSYNRWEAAKSWVGEDGF